jgi:hypothetical protein
VQREPVAGQAVASVIVELCRNEVQLDVGTSVDCVGAAQERTGLGDVGNAGAALAEQISKRHARFLDRTEIVSDGLAALVQSAHVEMVLQIGSDSREIGCDVNTELVQMSCRPDARQHQQLRRVDRAGT